MIFYTADTHFYHGRIMEFCPNTRIGKDYVEMTNKLIANWNSQVGPEDLVYHLGDFSFGKHEQTKSVLNRLNGRIILIKGNHDRQLLVNPDLLKRFESVHDYLEIKVEKIDVVLFHYPILEFNKMHYGAFHCFGHVHGKQMNLQDRRAMDVGIDSRPFGDMKLWTWDEIKEKLNARPIFSHH